MIHLSPLMAHVRSKQETGHDDMTRNSSTESAVAPVSKSKLARNIARVASRKVRIHHTYATCLVGFRRRTLSEQAMVSHATPCNKRDNHVCGNRWSPATSTQVAAVRKASATRPDSTAVTLYRMEPTSKALRSSERDKAPGKILGKHATHRKNATRSSICVKLTMAWRRQVVGAAAAPCASQGEPAPADGARSPPQNHAHGSTRCTKAMAPLPVLMLVPCWVQEEEKRREEWASQLRTSSLALRTAEGPRRGPWLLIFEHTTVT